MSTSVRDPNSIKIVIVDDLVLVRDCIRALVELASGIEVVGEADNGEDAIQVIRDTNPDQVILDIMMPGLSSIEVTNRIKRSFPKVKIIILTAVTNNAFPQRLLDIGAAGYLTKGTAWEELIQAIRTVQNSDETYITPTIAQNLALKNIAPESSSSIDKLSDREFQIMMMIINGHKVEYIADKLCLSPKTINSHRYRIFAKLDVQNDVELTHFAIKQGIIEVSPPE